jgi:hypothetical protein
MFAGGGGSIYSAWISIRNTQSDGVKQEFDEAWDRFGEGIVWLTILTTAPGQEPAFENLTAIIDEAYHQHLDMLAGRTTFGEVMMMGQRTWKQQIARVAHYLLWLGCRM